MIWSALSVAAMAAQLYGMGVFIVFMVFLRPRVQALRSHPGVTVLKPCFQIEDGEPENYDVFFRQDYPGPVQLLFIASRETDPAVTLVRNFLRKYPQVDAQLVLSETRNSYWGKIDAIHDGLPHAKHDHVIISDSDVQVRTTYLSEMVAALQEPGVSLVSSPQFDTGANTIGSGLKLANNCDTAVLLLGFYSFSPVKRLSLGHSIGFRRSEFDQLGSDRWEVINTFLAEDLAYAYLFTRAGKRAVLRNIFCPVTFSNKTIGQTHRQKLRWLLNQKMGSGGRWRYLLGVLFYPEITGLLSLDWRVLAAACLVRILVSLVCEAIALGSIKATLRYFWLIPLWDLAQLYYFVVGFFKTTIRYGDREYRVVNRRFLEEVKGKAAS